MGGLGQYDPRQHRRRHGDRSPRSAHQRDVVQRLLGRDGSHVGVDGEGVDRLWVKISLDITNTATTDLI